MAASHPLLHLQAMHVLLIDDHPLYRDGMKVLLSTLDPQTTTVDAGTVAEALAIVGRPPAIDLVLLDMNLPGTSRLDGLRALRQVVDSASIVVISADEDADLVLKAIDAGAAGYIPKSTDTAVTVHALRLVLAHGIYLPPSVARRMPSGTGEFPAGTSQAGPGAQEPVRLSGRQRAVLRSLLQGKSNKVIARELDIAEGTVKAHLWSVYQVLGVANRLQAMCRVHELGILDTLA